MADQIFEGTFVPPMMGIGDVPIPLSGQGSLAIAPDALVVKGYRSMNSGLVFLIFLITLAVAIGVAYAISRLSHQGLSAERVGAAIGAAIASVLVVPRLVSKKPWELAIPWQSITKVRVDISRTHVQVTVKKHKPRGLLHFKPGDGPNQVVIDAITARISR